MSTGKASIIQMRGLKSEKKHGEEAWPRCQRLGNLITFRMEETGIREILGTGKNLRM